MQKFYCQNCGYEVPLEVNACPNCKSTFGSVLCPKCNFTGSSNKFINGCPECGYLRKIYSQKKSNFGIKTFIILFTLLILTIVILIVNF